MIYLALIHYKKGQLNGVEILSWITIWTVAIFIVSFPEILRTYASTFLVTRIFDMMVLGGFILVISLVSAAYLKSKRNEKKLEELIRKLALKDIKKKSK
jgi:hypothetical protein